MKIFLRIVAIYLGIIGIVSLLVPQVGASQIGHAMTSFDIFVGRSLGIVLMTIAFIDWSMSLITGVIVRGLLLSNIFMNTGLALIDSDNILNHTLSPQAWVGISFHILFIIGFAYYFYQSYRKAGIRN